MSSELNYAKTNVSPPSYQLSLLTQQSGGSQVTLNAAGGQQSVFELPANIAYNLSKSVLTFNYTIPAPGAVQFNVVYNDCIPLINQITLYTRANIKICDIPNFQYYTKVIQNTDTHLSEFMTNGNETLHFRSDDLKDIGIDINTQAARPNGAGGNLRTPTNASLNYTEPAYVTSTPGAQQVYEVNAQIKMSQLKNTIFACDKDLLFNEIIYLRIYWAPYTSAGFRTVQGTGDLAGGVAFFPQFNIDNLYFYLAVDENISVTNALKQKIMTPEGLSVLIDYTTPQLQSFAAGIPNQSITYKFNRGDGITLKRIYHTIFNGSYTTATPASANILFDHNNSSDGNLCAKVNSYYTMLDNQRIQQFNIDCVNYNDWMIHSDKLKESVLQNFSIYKYNWVHIDSFDNMNTTEHNNNDIVGLDLSLEKKWDFIGTGFYIDPNVSFNHMTFAVTQKILTVSSAGITVT